MNLHGTGPAQGFWVLLTDDERAALSRLGRTAVYPPGTVMCVEGDPATHVFVLVNGWVKIVGVTSEGHELTLALRGRGDTVGEMAAETTGHRTATVQAIGTVRALVVPDDKFSSFLDAHDGADRQDGDAADSGGTGQPDRRIAGDGDARPVQLASAGHHPHRPAGHHHHRPGGLAKDRRPAAVAAAAGGGTIWGSRRHARPGR